MRFRSGEGPDILGLEADLVAGGLQLVDDPTDLGLCQRADLDLDHAGTVALEIELFELHPVGALAIDEKNVDMSEPRRATGQPERHQEEIGRILLEEDEQAFPRKVHCNQHAVEIDRKRKLRSCPTARPLPWPAHPTPYFGVFTMDITGMTERTLKRPVAARCAGSISSVIVKQSLSETIKGRTDVRPLPIVLRAFT